MKTVDQIADEFFKLRQLLWYVDWLEWHKSNPIEHLEVSVLTDVYNPAMSFADTIDHAYQDEIDTRRLQSASDLDRAKLLGQCVALAWVHAEPIQELELLCGPKKGEGLPKLPGVWEP